MASPAGTVNSGHAEICVLAPWPILTVTIERSPAAGDELYFHAGGQGFWVARMIVNLGLGATLCGPFGGETGRIVKLLVETEGVRSEPVPAHAWNGGYVHDRRDGKRREIAVMDSPALNRHEVDDLYNAVLAAGLRCRNVVLTGVMNDNMMPVEMFRRLAHDLDRNGVTVCADLSGASLQLLDGGIEFLKVSHEVLIGAGYCSADTTTSLLQGLEQLRGKARNIVVSRAGDGALARFGDRLYTARGPSLEALDHSGAGDSMTAALAVAAASGLQATDALRLALAAGTLNVTRRGRGTGDGRHIEEMARHVELRELQ